MINERDELNKIVILLEEYTTKLRNLMDFFNRQRTQRFQLIYMTFAFISLLYAIGIFYSAQNHFYSDIYILFAFTLLLTLGMGLITLSLNKFTKDNKFIRNEIRLIYKQLKKILEISSTYQENFYYNEIQKFELNLRIIEAEDMIIRTEELITFDKTNYNK